LKRAAKEVGLSLNVNKTKIMAQSWCDTHIGKEMKIGDTIEVADEFVYLGTCIIKHRCEMTYKEKYRTGQQCIAVPTPNSQVKSGTQQTKTKLFRTLIGSVLWWGSGGWTLSQTAEEMLNAFQRKVLRRIYGPVV